VLDETDWDVTPDEENPMDPPGFDEALLGLRPGDEKDFVLSWPAESQSIHAGKQANFHVKVHKIQGSTEPALDDSFAQMVGPEFETLDALKENIRTTLLEAKKQESEEEYLEKTLDALMAQSTLDYPPTVVEDQLDTMVNTLERQLREFGIDNLEQYLQQMGQTVEQYRDGLRAQAEIMAKRNLIISEIFRQEGISVTDEEIDERINRMLGINTGAAEAGSEASPEGHSHDEHDHEGHDHEEHDHDDHDHEGHDHGADNADTMHALRDMMKSGSGRAVLESQILQENSIARLLAIVRGEEVPERPAPKVETTEAQAMEIEAASESASAPLAENDTEPVASTEGDTPVEAAAQDASDKNESTA
jgi:trigger factor